MACRAITASKRAIRPSTPKKMVSITAAGPPLPDAPFCWGAREEDAADAAVLLIDGSEGVCEEEDSGWLVETAPPNPGVNS